MITWTYWTGPKNSLIETCLNSSIKHNNTQVLDERSVRELGYDGPLEGLPAWAQADLIRLWLLSKFGGAWIDADTICLKPLDMSQHEGSLICFGTKSSPRVSNAIMFARDTSLMSRLYAEALETLNYDRSYGSIGQKLLARHLDKITVLEHWRYMPIHWTHVDQYKIVRSDHWTAFNPNACCYHITSRGLQGAFDSRSFLFFLFDRALGFARPPRSASIARRAQGLSTGVEVGVFKAENARSVLQLCPKLTLHLVDTWARTYSRSYELTGDDKARIDNSSWERIFALANRNLSWAGNRAVFHRQSSLDASKLFDDNSIDFVFIDADHSYEGISKDIDAWLPKARVWIGGHDYFDRWPGVKRAVNERFSSFELDEDYTWFHYLGKS